MEANDGSDIEALEASSAASSNDVTFTNRKLGKSVTLDLLIREGILQPEPRALTIKYMGRRFSADLLANGHIQPCDSVETFPSPSAWVMHCKKQVNPATKVSGCGWGTIRYKGQTLNVYKVMWLNKQASALGEPLHHAQVPVQVHGTAERSEAGGNHRIDSRTRFGSSHNSVPIDSIPLEAFNEQLETAVTCYQRNFSSAEPCHHFRVRWSCQAVIVMVAHCHGQSDEASGYLGGQDANTIDGQKVLVVQKAFPFAKTGQWNEDDLRGSIRRCGLRVCGWYHSHSHVAGRTACPTLYDVECQLRFQRSMATPDAAATGQQHAFLPSVCCVISPYLVHGTESVFVKDEDFSHRFQCFYVSEEKKPAAAAASSTTAASICGYPYCVDQLELDMSLPAVTGVQLVVENMLKGSTDGPLRTLKFISHLAQAYGSTYVDDVRQLLTNITLKANITEHDRAKQL